MCSAVRLALRASSSVVRGDPAIYGIDAGAGSLRIRVGKAGLFGFALGHAHEIVATEYAGWILFDPTDWSASSVQISVAAAGPTQSRADRV